MPGIRGHRHADRWWSSPETRYRGRAFGAGPIGAGAAKRGSGQVHWSALEPCGPRQGTGAGPGPAWGLARETRGRRRHVPVPPPRSPHAERPLGRPTWQARPPARSWAPAGPGDGLPRRRPAPRPTPPVPPRRLAAQARRRPRAGAEAPGRVDEPARRPQGLGRPDLGDHVAVVALERGPRPRADAGRREPRAGGPRVREGGDQPRAAAPGRGARAEGLSRGSAGARGRRAAAEGGARGRRAVRAPARAPPPAPVAHSGSTPRPPRPAPLPPWLPPCPYLCLPPRYLSTSVSRRYPSISGSRPTSVPALPRPPLGVCVVRVHVCTPSDTLGRGPLPFTPPAQCVNPGGVPLSGSKVHVVRGKKQNKTKQQQTPTKLCPRE